MAEEAVVKTEEVGIVIPGEVTPVQQKAMEKGWRPKEQWDKDPEDWVDAKEYLRVGEILDKYSSLKGELWQVKRDMDQLAKHHKNVAEVEYKRALDDLKTQRVVAAKEGDTEAVVQISEKIDDLKDNKPTPIVAQPAEHPAFTEWKRSNPWFETDEDLKGQADAFAVGYRAKNTNASYEEILNYVTERIKKVNPEKFGTRKTVVSTVEGSTNNGVGRKSSKFGEADLNDVERSVMKNLVDRKVLTKEQYISDLAKVKGIE